MPSSMNSSLTFISQQIDIYFGFIILITGTLGGILNIIIFLSLRTFRKSSCAFYLTIMSIVNIGQLYTGLFPRIMISGFKIDWTEQSLFSCKFRLLFFQLCTLISLTCLCLAIIDQYFATCSHHQWQQWCNIKLAQCLIIGITLIWILSVIPYAIFYGYVVSRTTNKVVCVNTNPIFERYEVYFIGLVLNGFLPVIITVLFGTLAYRNVQQLTYRTVPLVRRELDKQLTKMVLVQVVLNQLIVIPFVITKVLSINLSTISDPVILGRIQFASSMTLMLFYSYFASPFYIYLCASERFRRQLIYVLFEIHFNRCRVPRIVINQVIPEE